MSASIQEAFARDYAAAWCSQNPASVAAFYEDQGSLQINAGEPSIGRAAIAAAAQSFMTAFPDMIVSLDEVISHGNGAIFRWTLTGNNTGPGGTGKAVRISGHEAWTFGENGLILESLGHFDEDEYQRQLNGK
jgi:predicted ester cyclase